MFYSRKSGFKFCIFLKDFTMLIFSTIFSFQSAFLTKLFSTRRNSLKIPRQLESVILSSSNFTLPPFILPFLFVPPQFIPPQIVCYLILSPPRVSFGSHFTLNWVTIPGVFVFLFIFWCFFPYYHQSHIFNVYTSFVFLSSQTLPPWIVPWPIQFHFLFVSNFKIYQL